MADLFISYKRIYRADVAVLAERLQTLGISVWYDAGLIAGEQYRSEIKRELAASKASIACWTPECFADNDEGWVRWEAQYARNRGHLVPVFLRPTELEPPFHLDHVEDLSAWVSSGASGEHDGWRRLVSAIELRLDREGLLELDDAFAPLRAAGVTHGVGATPAEIKTTVSRLDAGALDLLSGKLKRWAEVHRKSGVAKRVADLARDFKPAQPAAVAASPLLADVAGATASQTPARKRMSRAARDDKGHVLVNLTPITSFKAAFYGLSMVRAAPQLLLALGVVLIALQLWSKGATQDYTQALAALQASGSTDIWPVYAKMLWPALASLIIGFLVQTSILRGLIRGEGVTGVLGLNLGADEFRLIVVNVVVLLGGTLVYMLLTALVVAASTLAITLGGSAAGIAAGALAGILALILFLWFVMRATPIAAATVARRRFAFVEGWRLSKKAGLKLLGALLLLIVPYLVVVAALTLGGWFLGVIDQTTFVWDNSPIGTGATILLAVLATPFLAAYYGIGAYVFVQRATAE